VIAVAHKSVSLGGCTVLHDVSFAAGAGELVALCGPNGAGKSTLLRALAGLLPGTVPQDPRHVAWLPQGARSAWGLTVEQVAALGRIPHRDRADAAITKALEVCGIVGLRAARVDRISGGEARRAMLARAFATEPDVFLPIWTPPRRTRSCTCCARRRMRAAPSSWCCMRWTSRCVMHIAWSCWREAM
jgi:iron complex transport system ATP-binding protein